VLEAAPDPDVFPGTRITEYMDPLKLRGPSTFATSPRSAMNFYHVGKMRKEMMRIEYSQNLC
jgi:hypothetical protein